MLGAIHRMATGLAKFWTQNDPSYFTRRCPVSGRTKFRSDVRAIAGGALAAAFIAAGLISMSHHPIPRAGELTAAAATLGAIAGKFVLA